LALDCAWGFYAHKHINRLAVFTLPPEMLGFYKKNIAYITEAAVNPDRRRYVVEGEAARHYIDLDHYGDSALARLSVSWELALLQYPEDTLRDRKSVVQGKSVDSGGRSIRENATGRWAQQ